MKFHQYAKLSLFFFIVAGILLLINSQRFYGRLDVSKNKQFSLSPESKLILDEIDETLTITYYVSTQLQNLYPQVGDVHDFLLSYQNYKQHIVYKKLDPAKENIEQSLISLGVLPQQIQTSTNSQTSFLTVFSAIAIEYQGNTELIPFVLSATTLEFDLAMRIKTMLQQQKPLVQIFVANELTLFDNYTTMGNFLENAGFYVQAITEKELPYLDLNSPLIVFGQKYFTDDTTLLLEEFLMKGGNALFAVTQNETTIMENWEVNPLSINQIKLTQLLEFWGVQIQQDLVLDTSNFRITMARQDQNTDYQYINYPFWVTTLNQNTNKENSVIKNVPPVQLFWPSSMILFGSDDLVATTLFTSSSASWVQNPLDQAGYRTNPFEQYNFESNPRSLGTHILASQFEGKVSGYRLTGKSEPVRFIVIADEYLFSNMLHQTGTSANLDFLLNAVLWLVEDEELLEIRQKYSITGYKKDFIDENSYNQRRRSLVAFQFIFLPLSIIIFFLIWNKKRK
ncbi:MAG: Gldg family protein [Treponemataceae bacterium]